MTNDELDRLTALANAATPGPWVFRKAEYGRAHEVWAQAAEYETVMDNEGYYPQGVTPADQEFCAAARDAVPALVAEVKRLRGLVREAYDAGYHWGHNDWRTQYEPVRRWEESDVRNKLDGAA